MVEMLPSLGMRARISFHRMKPYWSLSMTSVSQQRNSIATDGISGSSSSLWVLSTFAAPAASMSTLAPPLGLTKLKRSTRNIMSNYGAHQGWLESSHFSAYLNDE